MLITNGSCLESLSSSHAVFKYSVDFLALSSYLGVFSLSWCVRFFFSVARPPHHFMQFLSTILCQLFGTIIFLVSCLGLTFFSGHDWGFVAAISEIIIQYQKYDIFPATSSGPNRFAPEVPRNAAKFLKLHHNP